eukprot:scaffold1637_cov410-Prasinococcus_capsulatus_cf.AAC.37
MKLFIGPTTATASLPSLNSAYGPAVTPDTAGFADHKPSRGPEDPPLMNGPLNCMKPKGGVPEEFVCEGIVRARRQSTASFAWSSRAL